MTTTLACAKCAATMTPGILLDEGYGSVQVSRWQPGPPRKTWWSSVRTRKRDTIDLVTWRCDACGYIESYAIAP